ncbi:MAG TPA: SPOR domain-containing protein [Gammaproteobacteria bacterium]|nr:SPOR domain-containing protein [Gammaproteobacteria bacterium]
MDQILKQRLVGAVVLVSVGILFLPVLFEGVPTPEEPRIETTNIPPKPEADFNSRIIPLESDATVTLPPPATPTETESPSASPPPATPAPAPAATPPSAPPVSTGSKTPDAAATPATPAAGKPATAGKPAEKVAEKSVGGKKPLEQNQTDKSPPPAAPARTNKPGVAEKSEQRVGVTAWVVQLGSFGSEQNANELETRLKKEGYAAFVEKLYASDGQKFRVRIGPELVRAKAQEMRDKVEKDMNLKGIVVRYP